MARTEPSPGTKPVLPPAADCREEKLTMPEEEEELLKLCGGV